MHARLLVGGVVGVGLLFSISSCSEDTPPPAGPSPPVVAAAATDQGAVSGAPAARDLIGPSPPVRSLIELPTLEVGGTIRLGSDCVTPATWASSAPDVATVDNGLVTGVSVGTARISETCGSVTSTVIVQVVAASATFAFDPEPPHTIKAGDTGHFRVNITRDESARQRLTEGVTSSSGAVALKLEGDRWRYTGVSAGKAEIRVVHGGQRRLTHAITVQPPPQPDYEIARVTRYDASGSTADWVYFTWRARVSASRFEVRVKFQQGSFFSTCNVRWYNPEAGEQERDLAIPSVCGSDEQWSTVTIEAADGRTCRGCGTFRRSDLPQGRNLTPDEELYALRNTVR